jgi:hypothetical protein
MNEQNSEKRNPWTTIWLDPRGTIRYVLDTHPMHSFLLLIGIGGIGNVLSSASGYHLGDYLPFNEMIISCLIIGPPAAFISVYLWSWLLSFSTRFLGGSATKQQLRTAFAWSLAPIVYTFPLWGVKYILFRQELFTTEKSFIDAHQFLENLFGFFQGVDFIISLFTFYILINAVAEVSGFSFWRSIGSIAIVLLIMTIPALFLLPFLPM